MKTKINKLPKSEIEIDFELSVEELKEFEDKAILDIGKDFQTDGFRKGKVPKEVILKKIGEEALLEEAANIAVQESYLKFVFDNKIETISKPEASITKIAKGNPFQFKIKVAVMPEITLPDYKKIAGKVEKKKVEVSKKDIDDSIEWARKSRAKFSLKNTPAEKGDFIEIDYFLSNSKEKYNDAFILGEGKFKGGFEDELIGLKNEEEKKGIKVKTNEEKEIKADVKVMAVKKLEMPEVNDEFAKSLGNFKGLDDLRKSVEEGLKKEKDFKEKDRLRAEITDKINKEVEIEIPDVLIEREAEMIEEDLKKRIKETLNIDFEEYLKKSGKKEEEIRKSAMEEAERKIKTIMVLREIGKEEKIDVKDEEVEEESQKILNHYKDTKDIKIEPEELKERVKESLVYEKTFKMLENCVK